MIGTLLTQKGAARITRAELSKIETPPPTRTWKPIPHHELLETLDQELTQRGLAIRNEAYAIQRGGYLLFGVVDLAWRQTAEYGTAIGIRTANDKTYAIQLAIGLRVFECGNLMFAGDVIALKRKHTPRVNLSQEMAWALDRYQHGVVELEHDVTLLQNTPLSDEQAKLLLFEIFDQQILPARCFHAVSAAYFHPPAHERNGHASSLWALHNACTRQVHHLSPGRAFMATIRLGRLFRLGQRAPEAAHSS